jgi:hypothetical protein
MDFEALLASAGDMVATRRYRRGSARASLGNGRKQTLLRSVLRAYGRYLTASNVSPAVAPRLRLSRRDLHAWRCELSHGELAPEEASDALYEWSRLLRRKQLVDIELNRQLFRVVLEIHHPRDAETFHLSVVVTHDVAEDHNYAAVTIATLDDIDLRVLLATRQTESAPSPTCVGEMADEPLGRDAAVVTTFLSSFVRTVADKMPERIRKAAARIRHDRQERKKSTTTALAVLAILIAGMFAMRKVVAFGVADTILDVSSGTTEKRFVVEQDGHRVRLVDADTLHPRSDWAQSIVDPVTGDRVDAAGLNTFIFRAGPGLTTCTLACEKEPKEHSPQWWFDDDGKPVPGIAIDPLPDGVGAERLHILYAVFPRTKNPAVLDAVARGRTLVDFGEGIRFTGMKYLNAPTPLFIGSYHFREPGLKEIVVQWQSAQGAIVEEQYALVCVGYRTGTHSPETVNLRVPTGLPFATWFRCEQGAIWSKTHGTWRASDEDSLVAEYRRYPKLPHHYVRQTRDGSPAFTWTNEYYQKLFQPWGDLSEGIRAAMTK